MLATAATGVSKFWAVAPPEDSGRFCARQLYGSTVRVALFSSGAPP
jgi:hypothetical protein